MAIKAILFDIDNTLVDFMKMKTKSCEAAIEAMIKAGLKANREEGMKALFTIYDKYGIEYQPVFIKLLKQLNGKADYKIIASGIIAYREMKETHLIPYPNVVSTLKEIKKDYKLAVVSDAPAIQAWMRLVGMHLDPFFDVVITKADARKQKTHAAPFRAALRALNIKPEEAVMVGDRISRDINTAKKLGIKTIYARYGDESPPAPGKSGADAELQDISEVLSVLEKWK
jgi:HAD superfamily hydrolase (TIGR02253 family)